MEVVVLPPQDCLKRHHHNNQRRLISPNKPRRNPNPNQTNPSYQTTRSNRRRRNSNSPPPQVLAKDQVQTQSAPIAMTNQIRILRRGEVLPKTEPEFSPYVRPDPEPKIVCPVVGPMINGFYAGSACVTSPSPSELPLPAFFTRSCGLSLCNDDVDNNQKIASDLRRVLKLF